MSDRRSSSNRGSSHGSKPWSRDEDGRARRTNRLDNYVPSSVQRETDKEKKRQSSSGTSSEKYSVPSNRSSGESSYERYLAQKQRESSESKERYSTRTSSGSSREERSRAPRRHSLTNRSSSGTRTDPSPDRNRSSHSGERLSSGRHRSKSVGRNYTSSGNSSRESSPEDHRRSKISTAERIKMFEKQSGDARKSSASKSRSSKQALEYGGKDKYNDTSRELRTRRLRQERESSDDRQERRSSHEKRKVESSGLQSRPGHYQAHNPEVEKHLSRSHLISGIREDGTRRERARESGSSSDIPSAPDERRSSYSRQQELEAKRIAREAEMNKLRQARKERDAQRQAMRTSVKQSDPKRNPDDENKRTTHSATRGWSTLKKPPTEGADDVGRYLALRKQREEGGLAESAKSTPQIPIVTSFSMVEDSASSQSSENDSVADESSEGEADEQEWSVRVYVVSAMDFPANVVPNLPLSPVLNVGLMGRTSVGSVDKTPELAEILERDGIVSVPRSRVQCTGSKILSKRDNGSVEFHEEFRWDRIRRPETMALGLELSARAVIAPANIKESPPSQIVQPIQFGGPAQTGNRAKNGGPGDTGMGSIFRRQPGAGEMETANAAAAVAQHLVNENETSQKGDEVQAGPLFDDADTTRMQLSGNQSEINVKLRRRKQSRRVRATKDLRLGSHLVPLSRLPLNKALQEGKEARIEQWVELENFSDLAKSTSGTSPTSLGSGRHPRILLEITLSLPENIDDSEDEMLDDESPFVESSASFAKRESMKIRNQLKQDIVVVKEEVKEPVLDSGVVDFICVVGAGDIGDQRADDGSSGWVNSTPECCLLEQFPPNDDFHSANDRIASLPNKIEWFCFPEGCRLWRGSTPPNADELNQQRFSSSSFRSMSSTSVASFDACLGCTTSFSWFVIASNSDEYGSETAKTYGACIRFYVPAPAGIDPTQDDFAQMLMDGDAVSNRSGESRRLWVPLGICLTSTLPIIGVLEAMLLRLCDKLSLEGICSFDGSIGPNVKGLYEDLAHLIVNYQRPIPGVVNCSIPFLAGERLHISLPPRTGLPPLPHGNAVTTVCRLLGSDGINYLLATLLTECKVLLHSDDVANLCLVAEVMTALIYPFQWSCPYVPVLPAEMMEFLEAPVSFILGVPSCNINLVEPHVLEEIVVVDLDRDFCEGSDMYGTKRIEAETAKPPSLPYSMSSNIAKAVQRLLRAEDEVDGVLGGSAFPSNTSFPRLEQESLAEREFRLFVALEVCGLLRGLQGSLVYSAGSRPVFDAEKFLEMAPALQQEARSISTPQTKDRKALAGVVAQGVLAAQKVAQRRSTPQIESFLSCLINCQHFHQLVETLDSEGLGLFREIMDNIGAGKAPEQGSIGWHIASDQDAILASLCESLQKQDDKIPTYRVKKPSKESSSSVKVGEVGPGAKEAFPTELLKQIVVANDTNPDSSDLAGGVKQLSLEYLVQLEKNPWRYQQMFDIDMGHEQAEPFVTVSEPVKLRDAIGERRYRAWKMSLENEGEEGSAGSDEDSSRFEITPVDLADLAAMTLDSGPDSSKKRVSDAKDRDILRRCLELTSSTSANGKVNEKEMIIISEAARSLRNPAARQFLLTILGKRLQQGAQSGTRESLNPHAFEVLVHMGCAMLDACLESKDYVSAYTLLKLTSGLQSSGENDSSTSITGKLSLHPMYADLELWRKVKLSHASSAGKQTGRTSEDDDKADYDAVVATLYEMLGYGIPAEELSRFASKCAYHSGWFEAERGQNLLMLARRLCVRRDQGSTTETNTTDLEMMTAGRAGEDPSLGENAAAPKFVDMDGMVWVETAWCHPAAQSSKAMSAATKANRRQSGTQNLLNMLDEQKLPNAGGHNSKHMKRSAVTSMAYLGSSVVVTGGLDGGVFLARRLQATEKKDSRSGRDHAGVCGIHLDWGSSGSRYNVGSASTSLDGEYGVGSVSCLAATRNPQQPKVSFKNVLDVPSEEELLSRMEGCRVVAGTTCGDLRVWVVKDVLSAVFFAGRGQGVAQPQSSAPRRMSNDFAAGSSLTRLKFSLRGRALSGHRGGVCCIDVPSNMYRPDSIVTGGADGLIKLWNLRSPSAGSTRRLSVDMGASTRRLSLEMAATPTSPGGKSTRGGDALSIMSGHGGRVLCVKTAWHGDRLLSGGADRTVRLWDIAGSNGHCLNSLWGHFGWVTQVEFWGPNTIISASTDRSIALWDSRVRNSPLFSLRHHYAPISNLLVGPRTDPIMISSATDGTVAAWDFRHLSNNKDDRRKPQASNNTTSQCKIVRDPVATYFLNEYSSKPNVCGPVRLCRGLAPGIVQCVGRDSVVRDWDIHSGEVLSERHTGHCDMISNFSTLQNDKIDGSLTEESSGISSTITTSWDGTIRMRRLARLS